jgi:predicted Zn-dependent peptidase
MNTKTYENGFRLVHETPVVPSSNIASLQVFCDIGSIHEPKESRGSAHFIEHMCFKGTKRLKTSKEVNLIFDKTGSVSNAYTDRRYTCYYADTNKDNVRLCISTLADMLLNSVFDKTEYMKEREVVREETVKDADDYEFLSLLNADKQIYAGSPYEHPVDDLKYHDGKDALKYENILEIYKKFYVPSNFILSVCSSIPFETVCKYVEQSDFTKAVIREPRPSTNLCVKPQSDVAYCLEKRVTNPVHICIGFRTCAMTSPDKYCLKLLKTVLSGKINSRMFMLLRVENGLTYTSYAYTDFFEHMGDFKMYAECDPAKVFKNGSGPGVFPLLCQMIRDLLEHGVTQEELDLAKGFSQGTQKMNAENSSVIAKYNGKNQLFNILSAPKYADKYKKFIAPISLNQIHRCIRQYFCREGMVVSVVSAQSMAKPKLCKFVDKIFL